jgi:hypothetical protein
MAFGCLSAFLGAASLFLAIIITSIELVPLFYTNNFALSMNNYILKDFIMGKWLDNFKEKVSDWYNDSD